MTSAIPLISPKSIEHFTAPEYKAYIEGMYADCPVRKAKRESDAPKVTFRWTKTGKPSVLISKRKPKYLTQTEFKLLSATHKIPQNVLFLYCKGRQIEIRPGAENYLTPESLESRESRG